MYMPAQRNSSLTRTLAVLKDVPGNIKRLRFDPETGAFEAEFRDPEPEATIAASAPDEQPAPDEPVKDWRFALEELERPSATERRVEVERQMAALGRRGVQ